MASAMTSSSMILVSGHALLGKIYFPRLIFPLTPIFTKMVDFGIAMGIVVAAMIYYHVSPTWNLIFLPLFILMMMIVPAGIGLWLSSLSIRFRDVKFAMSFIIRMLMYSAPIVYSASSIPETYRFIYSINPIVGVIEGLRSSLLGTPIPWEYIYPGMVSSIIILIGGTIYFKKMERILST